MQTGFSQFPDENVGNDIKSSIEFGEKYAKAIWSHHSGFYYKRKEKLEMLRKYAKAKQPIEQYKKTICNEFVDMKFLNVNWEKRLNVFPRFLRKAYNGIDIGQFKEKVWAISPEAREEKKKKKKQKELLFYGKGALQDLEKLTGKQAVPPEQIPISQEQIDLEEAISNPLEIEVGEELLISAIKNENRFEEIFDRVKRDVFEIGVGVARCHTDKVEGVKLEYIEPTSWGHSPTTDPYFRDCNFFWNIKKITIAQLRRICQNSNIKITDDEIRKLMSEKNHNLSAPINEGAMVQVMYFTFKTYHEKVYKKKVNRQTKSIKIIDRTKDGYNPNDEFKSDKSQRLAETYDVWYEGIATLGYNQKILSYQLAENMAEYRAEILPCYIAVAPRIDNDGYNAIAEELKPLIDDLQALEYKRQHLTFELRGNISEIDPDAISNISLGNKKLTPKEVLSLYFTKNLSFRKTIDEDGDQINSNKPITEQTTGIPYALREILTQMTYQINMIKESFGYANVDEQKPNGETLLDSEPYRLSDNLTLKDLVDKLFGFALNTSQVISSRVDDIFKYSSLQEKYINMIGLADFKVMEKFKQDRAMSSFGLFMDFIPTKQEKAEMRNDINTALSQGQISLADAMEIRLCANTRIASRLLKLRTEQHQKAMQESKQGDSQMQINVNAESSKISNEQKRETLTLEHQLRLELEKVQHENKMQQEEMAGRIKIFTEKMKVESNGENIKLNQLFTQEMAKMKKEMEKTARLETVQESAKQQSKLIDQRKGKLDGFYEPTQTPTAQEDDSFLKSLASNAMPTEPTQPTEQPITNFTTE